MSNLSGKSLGKVQVGELVARGGMAEVYVGEHATLNRKVAIKVMREHVESDADNRKRFEREARVVAGLRHPNIIQVFDYELWDGQPCLIMEYVPGASLGAYLKALHKRGEKLSANMVARIMSMLASAIDYAHAEHIIHRDLKPANVLLRSASGPIDPEKPLPDDVEPILTDFGLVRLLDSTMQTSTGTVSGTPAYMSPEQARGDKLDSKSDIYSLGVMLYEMLAGGVPFDAESSFGILMKHLNEAPPPISGISPDIQSIIDRALSKNPDFRYASAKEMVNEFTGVFNGETVSFNTIKLAKEARASATPQAAKPVNWNYIFGGLIALAFLIVGYFYLNAAPSVKLNQTVLGSVVYQDFNANMDQASITVTDLPKPKEGNHYEGWLLAQGGETRLNIGKIDMDDAGQGTLHYTTANQKNILEGFDQIEITIEPNNDPAPDETSGEVVASSVFPPLALVHIRHLLVKFDSAPDDIALVQGMWVSTEQLNSAVSELPQIYDAKDEALLRLKAEEIINAIVGSENPGRYKDWNGNGEINDTSDGYGLLSNGDPGYNEQGYISQVDSHAKFSAQAIDTTVNIKTHSANVSACIKNMEGWTEQILAKSLELQEMPLNDSMRPIFDEMIVLAGQALNGVDSNNNASIEIGVGECGAATVYEQAYYMAEMPLLEGTHRIPAPAPTESK